MNYVVIYFDQTSELGGPQLVRRFFYLTLFIINSTETNARLILLPYDYNN